MSLQESQYLLYFQGQYRGPYNESVLIDEINGRRIGQDLSVWNEVIGDWVPIGSAPEFESYESLLTEHTCLSEDIDQRQGLIVPSMSLASLDFKGEEEDSFEIRRRQKSDSSSDSSLDLKISNENTQGQIENPFEDGSVFSLINFIGNRKIILSITALAIMALVIVSSIISHYKTRLEIEPLLNRLDVSYGEITQARDFILEGGKKTPLVFPEKVAKGQAPVFRVFVDFPDHSQVLMTLKGVRKTLVGSIFEEVQTDFIVKDKMAGTLPLLKKDGHPVGQGFYRVTLSCLNCKGEQAAPVTLEPLLGIGIGDPQSYQSDLKSFHSLLKTQAESELIEIGEILKLMAEIIQSKRKISSEEKIYQQLESILLSIDNSVANSSYIFGSTYLELKQLMMRINQRQWQKSQGQLNRLQSQLRTLKSSVKTNAYLH